MTGEVLITKLRQIATLLDECLAHTVDGSSHRRKTGPSAYRKVDASTLPGRILALRESAFFKQPRTAKEVHEKLRPTYDCAPDRVAMALKRLMERRQLRKTSKKIGSQELDAYVW